MSTEMIISDLHEPATRKGALAFCRDMRRKHKPDHVTFIGDVVDLHSISFHAKHPEMPGPDDEFELALQQIRKWHKTFPGATIIRGNHDRRVVRKAEDAGIPKRCILSDSKMWETPNWKWVDNCLDKKNEIFYIHGDEGGGSMYPAYNMVRKMGISVVCGHHHSCAGVKWLVNPLRRMFGIDVGALIDDKIMAFAYSNKQLARSVLGLAIIKDGDPQFIPMHCGSGEKYHDSKF
ncbi:MAG TPA: metallophosphoesterase [bacterium]|nr:metallophosphoesterase [bacterium]